MTTPLFQLARASLSQAILSATLTAVVFDTIVFDTVSGWNGTTRWVVPADQGGAYILWAEVNFDDGGSSVESNREVLVRVNGDNGTLYAIMAYGAVKQPTGIKTQMVSHGFVDLVPGDYIELMVRQDSGSSIVTRPTVKFSGVLVDVPSDWPLTRMQRSNVNGQIIPRHQYTAITFDNVAIDQTSSWDASNKSRYVAPGDGVYIFWAETIFDSGANPTSTRRLVTFRTNGNNSTFRGTASVRSQVSPSGVHTDIVTSAPIFLSAGDYVELVLREDDPTLSSKIQPTTRMSAFFLTTINGDNDTASFAQLRLTAAQNIGTGLVPITWSVADYDTVSGWDGAHHSRWVVPSGEAGYYLAWGQVSIAQTAADASATARTIAFRINGSATALNCTVSEQSIPPDATNDGLTALNTFGLFHLNEGDYVELVVKQESGSPNLAAQAGAILNLARITVS